ncbi:MAG: PAS domain S-box protein [Flavobacteriaceae bacterium]|nr:PAS domain S-box protein [Flavobacteriaceae bacterium]
MKKSIQEKLHTNFNSILNYLTKSFNLDEIFITLDLDGTSEVFAAKGVEWITESKQLSFFTLISDKKENIVNYNLEENQNLICNKKIQGKTYFNSFRIASDDRFTSMFNNCAICFLSSEPKKFSELECSNIEQALMQIESLLSLTYDNIKLKETIEANENRFQLFVNNSKEIFYHLDLEGNFLYIADSWTPLLGYDVLDFLGKNFDSLIHPDDLESCFVFLDKIVENSIALNEHTYRIRHKNGDYVWQTSKISLANGQNGKYFVGVGGDITNYVVGKDKLEQQKNFYEKILDGLPTAVAVFDKKFRYQYLNPEAVKNPELRNYAIGRTNLEYEERAGRDKSFAVSRQLKYEEAILKRNTIKWEDTIISKEGKEFINNRSIKPVYDDEGNLDLLIGFGVDITESKRIQNEIVKNKQLLSNVLQNVAVGILVQGPDSEIIENNEAACKMLGLTQDQLLGKSSFDKYWKVEHKNGMEFKADEHPVPMAIKLRKPVNKVIMGVHRPITKDLVWLSVDAIPIFDDSNNLIHVICSFNDISLQKNVEDSLKEANERFELSSKATSDIIWDLDIASENLIFAKNYEIQFGFKSVSQKITLKEFEKNIHPEDYYKYKNIRNAAIKSNEIKYAVEYRYLKSNGVYATIKDKAIIIRDKYGRAIRSIGAMQDISFEKKLKQDLQQSEAQFKGAFDHTATGMAIVDTKGNWVEVNQSLCNILGYSKEQLLLTTIQKLTHPMDLEKDIKFLRKLIKGDISNFSVEKRFYHSNKSIILVNMFISAVRDNEEKILHYVAQIIDITESKRIEYINKKLEKENNRNRVIQLNEAKNMYRLLADNMIDLVCVHDLDGTFSYVSPSIYNILGYQVDEIIGKSPLEFVHIDDAIQLQQHISEFMSGTTYITAKMRFRNKKGVYIWCEVKGALVRENGRIKNFHTSTRDISETKEAALAIEKTLKQERELNELRTNLVSTISHEFRTPMTTIRSSAELIMLYLEQSKISNFSLVEKRINIILTEIDRIVSLMNTVLIISKNDLGKTTYSPSVLNLKQTCLDVLEISDFNHKKEQKIVTNFSKDYFPVYADKNLMEYILINILNNAYKYSLGASKEVILSLSIHDNKVIIEITDHGIGIPVEDQAKLFNTFYRASNTDGIEGTGLGLYIVKTFTERNLGKIKLKSKLGIGTTVILEFPLLNEKVEK